MVCLASASFLSRPDPSHSSLSDADVAHLSISLEDKSNVLEEVLTELSVYIGMLYHLIEIFKGHEDFAEELSECCVHKTRPRSLIQ